MFSPSSLATSGLYPGDFSPFSLASNGSLNSIVIITPIVPSFIGKSGVPTQAGGGGGFVPSFIGKPERYRVDVSVKINGSWHTDSQIVDDNKARVYAKFHGIQEFCDDKVMVSYNGIQIRTEQ